jgi:MYXO-CTERM domain-containing protein
MPLRLALAVLLLAAAPAAAQDDTTLLRRHAPVLHYDARDRDHATSVGALAPDLRGDDTPLRATTRAMPDVAHGRVARGSDGRRWLQYWLLYADNPQDRGIVRTGRHQGDWEVVQVALSRSGRPVEATYAQHKWAEACPYRGPDVFVANGSHASYTRRGTVDRPWPDPDDEVRGDGRVVRPRIEPFGAWARWPGRWGTTEAGLVPGEAPSPRGPAFQPDGPYGDPVAFHEGARACGSGAPPHPWPVYLAGALAVIGVALAGLRIVRTRVRRNA